MKPLTAMCANRLGYVLLFLASSCADAAASSAGGSGAAGTGTPSFLFLLGDDIGWADFRFPNNGTAHAPRLHAWAQEAGSVYLYDHHTGGTVCSPTRATILTGRNHFRDCVDYVYDCSGKEE